MSAIDPLDLLERIHRDAGSADGGVLIFQPDGRLNAPLLAGPDEGLPRGERGRIFVRDMPMLHEATAAQITGDRSLTLQVAFAQAAHCTVAYDMCPRWRWRRKAKLLDEALHRWFVARTVRCGLEAPGPEASIPGQVV